MLQSRQQVQQTFLAPPPSRHQHPSLASSKSLRPQLQSYQELATKHTNRDPPPPPPPHLPPGLKETKPKEKGGKLTELWPLPPDIIERETDVVTRGPLLGEGGFARVFLATEPNGGTKALKVIAKAQLKSTKTKSKLFGEIKIHTAMKHPNIVCFEHCFEDDDNVYMQLELCANGSLLDILRKRRRFSEPEARFYLVQLIGACDYMHTNSVIHRDLKLGNLMLDGDMNLRVGDFGLAALVKFPGERKKTICGTPNYIAPEILFDTTNGHSFEVDIWSIGVILYTLLVGKPPFQTKEVKNIYKKIKDNNYAFPPEIELSPEAIDLISCILTTEPDKRPTLNGILSHPFFVSGPFPPSIPPSSLTSPPDSRSLSIRASRRNFETVKAECRIVGGEVSPGGRMHSQALWAVAEECETEYLPRVEKQEILVKVYEGGMEKGMEKEVRHVLQPESPIADLLRSARKPLMVSPRSNNPNPDYRDSLQRKSASTSTAPVRSSSLALGARRSMEKEAVAPPRERARTTEREKENAAPREKVRETTAAAQKHRRHATNAVSAVEVGDVKKTVLEVVKEREVLVVKDAPEPRPSTIVLSKHPALDLYKDTWRTLDGALQIRSSSAVDLLPNPEEVKAPKVFITSWVDYTHKYGTAYSLTDGSAGLYFNDSTTMILSPDKIHYDYIANGSGSGSIYQRRHYKVTPKNHPVDLERKTYLLGYFEDYMSKTLLRDVEWTFVDTSRTRNMDFLVKYYRMKNAIVFKMSNNVLQFNFYDHTKLLLTQNGSVVTFIDPDFKLQSFSLQSLFREAARLGHFRATPTADPAGVRRLEQLRLIMEKLTYCRDVLKTLYTRRETASSSKAKATS